MFSVLILTLNEQRNLPGCLASIPAGAEVVVLDSGSTDGTTQLARAAGARVVSRPFDDFASQRNFAHRNLTFRYEWVFHLDADEKLTPALSEECAAAGAHNPADLDGFFAAPKMLFQGHWLPRCTDFPAWQARFVHATRFEFVQVGHGQRESASMRLGFLQHSYEHEMFPDGVAGWLEKHRRYAREEAAHAVANERFASWRNLWDRDHLTRRRALKSLSRRLPCRPAARIFYQYFLRRGFLDGRRAWEYCRLLGAYEGFIDEESRRLQSAERPSKPAIT